jgi:hypothetical protein
MTKLYVGDCVRVKEGEHASQNDAVEIASVTFTGVEDFEDFVDKAAEVANTVNWDDIEKMSLEEFLIYKKNKKMR